MTVEQMQTQHDELSKKLLELQEQEGAIRESKRSVTKQLSELHAGIRAATIVANASPEVRNAIVKLTTASTVAKSPAK